MFGERHFAIRERLFEVLAGVAVLAADTGTEVVEPLPQAAGEMGAPFLFVVCGEVNSGKSTFLNGLFGCEVCKVNLLPETKQVLWYRHGDANREVPVTPLLEERYRPLAFLRDFNLVDTPGTNSAVAGHAPVIARIMPEADLMFCVFPASNPWSAATWNFISRLPTGTLGRLVLIIQQVDQCAPADIRVILGHMGELAIKRLGQAPPMFAVSGKLACAAKLAAPFDAQQLAASGYPALEEFISKNVCDAPARNYLLEKWRAQAAAALRNVEDRLENQTSGIEAQGNFLAAIESEIGAMREQLLARLPLHLTGVAEVFQSEAVGVTRLLGKRLGVTRSVFRLFVGDRTGQEMEAVFIERLQAAVEAVAEADGEKVVEVCRKHWSQLGERVRQMMGVDLGDPGELDATLATARRRFVQRLGRAARQGIGDLKVRNQLGKDLRRRNVALKSFTFMMLLLLGAGATCGACAVPWAPPVLCGLSALFCLAGLLIGLLTRRSLVADFKQRLSDTCGAFASTLSADYEEALRIVFQDYVDCLGAVRRHLAVEKQAIEPRQRHWNKWFLTLKAIEQDL
ncbi:MAG: dynamin family protein [Verrucomicrobiota bacterium]